MKPLAALLVVLLVNGALAARDADTYSPPGGGFTVKFPGKPKETKTSTDSKLGKLAVHTATYSTSRGNAYMVSATQFPEGTGKPENRQAVLDGVRRGLKGNDRTVLSEEEIKIGKDEEPGHELILQSDRQRVRVRVFLIGDRLFQVGVIGSKDFVGGKDATAFLKSFRLTE